MSNLLPLSSKNQSKNKNSNRERDKNKSVASESGGSSQCDTPPLVEKDGGPSQGKFAGISAESIQCMADQIGAEINTEAATVLAEDISYKLRQTLNTIALHSEMMKKTCVDSWDVNTVLSLSDTSPVVGATAPHYVTVGEEKLCCEVETLVDIPEYALTMQSFAFATLPTASVEWITDEKSLNNSNNISSSLLTYYTHVSKAILNFNKKTKKIAVEDLATNTRIGPIFPNLFNLAVLVLNDDNLAALNVTVKEPLKNNVLEMVDALCSNPCRLDTNILQQYQRLFPVMVSNTLVGGLLADKMVSMLTKINQTWPYFKTIGKGILYDYLSQGPKDRITAQMIRCVTALGRQALVECLGDHLEHIDERIQAPRRSHKHIDDVREAMLEVSTHLLQSEPTNFLEDFVTTDYTLYEMLGDSILPRRTLFFERERGKNEKTAAEKPSDEDNPYLPLRPNVRRPKVRIHLRKNANGSVHKENWFEPVKLKKKKIQIRIKNCRSIDVSKKRMEPSRTHVKTSRVNGIVVASGLLNRFRYKLNKPATFPIFGALTF